MYNKLTKCVEKLVKIIEAIGNICVWGMFAIIFINTVLRVIIGYSLPLAEEISKLLMVWMAMIVSAVCLYEGRQVALTFLFDKISTKRQPIALLIFDSLSLIFSLVVMESGNLYVWDNMNATLPASGLPRYVLYLALPIGGLLMALVCAYLVWKRILQIKGKVPYESKKEEEVDYE